MWIQWKFSIKIVKNPHFDLFWGRKWLHDWTSEAHILHTSKVAPMSMQSKIDLNPVETFWQNCQKPEFLPTWEAKMTKKGASEAYFFTSTKVAPMSFKIKFHVNPVENFHENSQKLTFGPNWVSKRARIYDTQGPFLKHTWKHLEYVPSFMVPM